MEINYEARYNELARIVTNTTWSANERIQYAVLRIEAHKRPAQQTKLGSYALFEDLTEDKVAELAGVSKSTAGDTLRKFAAVGLVERKIERDTVNRFGVSIPRGAMTPDNGDHWQASTQTALPPVPAELPELPEAPRAERARVSSKAYRNRLNELSDKLRQLECPDCHKVSDWGAVCGACGRIWTADELANVAEESFPSHNHTERARNLPDICPIGEISGEVDTKRGGLGAAVVLQNAPTVTEPTEAPASPMTTTQEVADEPDARLSVYSPLPAVDDGRVTLQGVDTVKFFEDLAAQFCFVEPRGKKAINPRSDAGDELSWVDTPITGGAAINHLARGGNVGLLTGRGDLALIDVDDHLQELCAHYPLLAILPIVYRDNAPDRGKLLIALTDADRVIRSHVYKGASHKLELLALGNQGVIAGIHETGAEVRFRIGSIEVFRAADIDRMAREWTGTGNQVTPIVARALQSRPQGTLLRDAIQWWCMQASNQAEVDRLIASCPHKGKYIAVRADDRTPSTLADHDPYTEQVKRTYFDHGTKRKYDDLELFCELTGTDKGAYKWEVVNAFKAAMSRG